MTDPISDFLTRIRNAAHALQPEVAVPHSRMKESIAKILRDSGYISELAVKGDKLKSIHVRLKYQGKSSVITGLRRVSSPGLRRYVSASEIPSVLGGMGIAIVSTPKGVMTGSDARKNNVGGELVCFIW